MLKVTLTTKPVVPAPKPSAPAPKTSAPAPAPTPKTSAPPPAPKLPAPETSRPPVCVLHPTTLSSIASCVIDKNPTRCIIAAGALMGGDSCLRAHEQHRMTQDPYLKFMPKTDLTKAIAYAGRMHDGRD